MILAEQEMRYHSKVTYYLVGKNNSIQKGIEIELAEEMLFFIFYWMDLYLLSDSKPLCNQKNV